MDFMFVIVALLILCFIIIVHELGHFTMAKILGIPVDEFSIGFGPKIVSWKRKGILYAIRMFPVGGYVKFPGEDEEVADPRAFNNQKPWKRFLTLFAGSGMNFVLAFVVLVVVIMFFSYYSAPTIDSLTEGMPAQVAGLQVGDRIISINGTPITMEMGQADKASEIIMNAKEGETIKLVVMRGEAEVALDIAPVYSEEYKRNMIGVKFGTAKGNFNLFQAVPEAFNTLRLMTGEMLTFFKNLVTSGQGTGDVMGPVGTIDLISTEARKGFDMTLYLVVMISLNLGIINLLPLPALDGSRILFVVIEWIRHKPIDRNKEAFVHLAGLVAFMLLAVVMAYRDIARLITG